VRSKPVKKELKKALRRRSPTMREIRAAMPRRRTLFWDVNPRKINPTKNARYVIARIMDFGTDREARWMWRAYPRAQLRDVAQRSRVIRPETRTFWRLLTK
jgi:hypothetical protein